MHNIWGNTRDMDIEMFELGDQLDDGQRVDEPFAITIGSSNGAVIIEGTESELLRWVSKLTKIVHEELGEV